jgi:hypothetical protein
MEMDENDEGAMMMKTAMVEEAVKMGSRTRRMNGWKWTSKLSGRNCATSTVRLGTRDLTFGIIIRGMGMKISIFYRLH